MKGATIPYKANLDGSAEVIEGLIDEDGPTAIAGTRNLNSGKNDLGKTRTDKRTDLKGRSVPNKAAYGAYYKVKAK